MIKLLQYTYLMDSSKIEKRLDFLWKRYQYLLKSAKWEKLNEARAVLFLIGHVYCEKIAPEAIERRLHLLKKPLGLTEFLFTIDSKSKKLPECRKDKLFSDLEQFYIAVKKFKNKLSGGKFYMDEERFIKLYNKYNPDKKLKINHRGKF